MTKVPAGLAPAAFDHFEQFSVVITDTLYRLAGVRSYLKLCHKANGRGIQAAPLLSPAKKADRLLDQFTARTRFQPGCRMNIDHRLGLLQVGCLGS
jgi:hypothetical protein